MAVAGRPSTRHIGLKADLRALCFAFLWLTTGVALAAALNFPALTGRIVDEAGILSAQAKSELVAQLAAHEQATTNQVVVVTLKSLGGYDIADHANRLFRHWGIGQKGKNNGVLLVVAPSERKMRIEVGYGLEGVLTDAISRDIIERRIKPSFRQQNFDQGVRDGVGAILAALGGEYRVAPPPATAAKGPGWIFFVPFASLAVLFFVISAAHRFDKGRPVAARLLFGTVFGLLFGTVIGIVFSSLAAGLMIGLIVSAVAASPQSGRGAGYRSSGGGNWGSSGGGGSSSGGGFSGGGGSSGGGGASGGW